MKTWQKIVLTLVIIALITLIIISWGSMASVIFLFLLIASGTMYLLQRFLIDDRENDFVDDQNG